MPWRDTLRWAWQAFVLFGLGLLCLLVLAWLTLQWGILPHIGEWRPAIERHASRVLGVPVGIGQISVRSSGWIPALELRDVVLRDRAGSEALRLPRVTAALSPRSVVVLAPRLSQLYVEGARLLVRRDDAGRLHVGGLDLSASALAHGAAMDEPGGALDWLLRQDELVLRNGAVRWVDDQRAAPPLELTAVDVVVRNGLRSHDLRVDATPPAAWGDRLSLRALCRQPLFARPGDWHRWDGTLFADLPRGDVAQLKHHVDLPFRLDGGQGSLKLWLDFRGEQWQSATADLRLRDVSLRLAHAAEPLAISTAAGRFSATRNSSGLSLEAQDFGFETASGVAWPRGNLQLSWRQRQGDTDTARAADRAASAIVPRPATVAAASAPASQADDVSPFVPWDTRSPVTGGRLAADALDLSLMRRLAAALPLPAAAARWLKEYQPAGTVRNLAVQWTGTPERPATYRVAARLEGFGVAAGASVGDAPARPGWRNAGIDLDATEAGGAARISLDGGAIELPGVFEDPSIPFDHFAGTAAWTVGGAHAPGTAPPLALQLRDVRFENADARGQLQAQWRSGPGSAAVARAPVASSAGSRFPGRLELQGELVQARATRLARYLPRAVPENTRHYLRDAFPAGSLEHVKFNVRGDLADFPFRRARDGEFRIDGQVRDLTLVYVPPPPLADGGPAPAGTAPPWPPFTQLQGRVVLDRDALEIHASQARMGGLALSGVEGGIDSLHDRPTLSLKGDVSGPMPEFLRYVAQSPIGGWLGGGLAAATSTGLADLGITLAIPLQQVNGTKVTGRLTLANNDVRLLPTLPLLANARALVDFNERGMSLRAGSAQLLGGEATFEGGTQPAGGLRFNARGRVSADGLRRSTDDPAVGRLAGRLSGEAPYELQVDVADGRPEMTLTSSLAGLGVALPPPFDKAPGAAWPLRVTQRATVEGPGRARDAMHVEVVRDQAPVLLADVARESAPGAASVTRSAYAVGAPLPTPQPGGVAAVRLPAIDADAWLAFWRELTADPAPAAPLPPAGASAAAAGAALAPTSATATTGAAAWWPQAVNLQTTDLLLGGRHLSHLDLQLARSNAPDGEHWRANIVSDQTRGLVDYSPDNPQRGARVFARLDRLALDADSADDPVDAAAAGARGRGTNVAASSSVVPALDIVVDDFELNGKPLGKLEVAATLQSGARDWRLTRLAMTVPEARFTGTGDWSGSPARRMALDFRLDLSDSGAFLKRLGMGSVLKGGTGTLTGAVTWTGSPLALDYPSLHGQLKVALDAGQFLKADAGAGRLLGVLSLQSLPRRLTLDFRDLFSKGFAFDNVTGDVLIDRGVASTRDLRMRGLSAAVLMEGKADLKAETTDLRVIVVPEINAGAASLAYAAINPVIGLGTFLAQLFLRDPLMQAGTREFHVDGDWSDPRVEQVDHRLAVEAAAAAASDARAARDR